MSDTQYRIFNRSTDGKRQYVSYAFICSHTGKATFQWGDASANGARLFESADIARKYADAIEREVERRGYGKQVFSVAPATGGVHKTSFKFQGKWN